MIMNDGLVRMQEKAVVVSLRHFPEKLSKIT
jgi:hypothetical protein